MWLGSSDRVRPARALSLVGSCAAALVVGTTPSPAAAAHACPAVYADAIGDAGDAPDIERVTLRGDAGGIAVDVALAAPTELGPYGWILVGLDTDRSPYTGGGRGDELLVFANGEGTTLTRWRAGEFTPEFPHHDLRARLSSTDLAFRLSWADLGVRSFNFSVASLRDEADLAPGQGVATYRLRASNPCRTTEARSRAS